MSDKFLAPNGYRLRPAMETIPLSPLGSAPFADYRVTESLSPNNIPGLDPPPRSGLRPYLLLPSRLSLTILSLPLLSLILSISALLSSSSHALQSTQDAQARILATCQGVQQGVGLVEQLPRVMAEKVNEQVVLSVQASLRGLNIILMDSLTIIEQVIDFMVDTYRSLLMCTIQLAIQGTLSIVIGTVDLISKSITSSLNAIRTSIQSDISAANSLISSAVSSINSVTSIVNVKLSVPQFGIPSLSLLANVTIPTTFEDDLKKLNASIPDLGEVRTLINGLIDLPFAKLRGELNTTFLDLAGRFNASLLPVPGSDTSNSTSKSLIIPSPASTIDLCSHIDTSFLTDVFNSLHHLRQVGLALLILAFFVLWLTLVVWEWWTFKILEKQAETVEDLLEKDGQEGRKVDGMRIVGVVEHPVVEKYLGPVMDGWFEDYEKRDSSRWFFAYITHGPALALLLFGILTFFIAESQIAAVTSLRAHSVSTTSAAINSTASSLSAQLNAAAYNQSARYAVEMNLVIAEWQSTIDNEVFGPWLNTTTVVLNSTLVQFYAEITNLVNSTIGGTILAAPVNTFLYCILGSKINNLETALTWIQNNAHVTLPTISVNALMLSNSTMDSVTSPISAAATGGSGNGDTGEGVVGTIFDRYLAELRQQRLLAGLYVALWGLIVLVAAGAVLWQRCFGDRFMTWRLKRGGMNLETGSGRRGQARNWNAIFEEDQPNEKKSLPDVPSRWPGSSGTPRSDASFLNHPYDAPKQPGYETRPFPVSSHPAWTSRIPRIVSLRPHKEQGDTERDNRLLPEKPHCPVEQGSNWSDRLKGAVTTFLTVPGQVNLGRKPSQKSEESWTGYANSPWDDATGRYRDSSDNVTPARPPSPARTSFDDPKHWSMIYPKNDDGSRYPPLPFRSGLNQVTTAMPPHKDPFEDEDGDIEPVRTPVMQADFQGIGFPASRQTKYEHRRSLTASRNVQEHFDPRRHPRRMDPFDD